MGLRVCSFWPLVAIVVYFLIGSVSIMLPSGNIVVLFGDESMTKFFETTNFDGKLVVAMISKSLSDDMYLGLHLGTILDVWSSYRPEALFIMYQTRPETMFDMAIYEYIKRLPEHSMFVSMQHGFEHIPIDWLENVVTHNSLRPLNLLHLNHEQPWLFSPPTALDYTYPSLEELQHGYKTSRLVFRQYYFKPLEGYSEYLPVGAPLLSYSFRNESSPWFDVRKRKPLKDRKLFCHFRGRLFYNETSEAEGTTETQVLHEERSTLYRLKNKEGRLVHCDISERRHRPNAGEDFAEKYLEELSDAIFALCPGGNNPETFRLHEVRCTSNSLFFSRFH